MILMSDPRNRINPTVVVGAVVVVLVSAIALIFGLYAVLDAEQYDRVPGILTSALGVIAPTILGLMALIRVDRQSDTVDVIKENTNGALSALMSRLDALEASNNRVSNSLDDNTASNSTLASRHELNEGR